MFIQVNENISINKDIIIFFKVRGQELTITLSNSDELKVTRNKFELVKNLDPYFIFTELLDYNHVWSLPSNKSKNLILRELSYKEVTEIVSLSGIVRPLSIKRTCSSCDWIVMYKNKVLFSYMDGSVSKETLQENLSADKIEIIKEEDGEFLIQFPNIQL
jgi:hypothetical protein